MDWEYNGEIFNINDHYGFVYLITNLNNHKRYIGKKTFWFKKYKIVKGKRKRILVESNWKDYYGSCETLTEDVNVNGESTFKREILKLCNSKSECTYYEAKYQFQYDVLLNQDLFYNSWISCKIMAKNLNR